MIPNRLDRLEVLRLAANGSWLMLCGLGLGWLIGLSVSPVIQNVIAGLITVVISLASVLIGLKAEPGADQVPPRISGISPFPMAALVLGLAVGSSLGIYARTHNWLGSSLDLASHPVEKSSTANLLTSGVLMNTIPADECARLRAAMDNPDQLEREMRVSSNPGVREFAKKCAAHPDCLRAAVESLLCSEAR